MVSESRQNMELFITRKAYIVFIGKLNQEQWFPPLHIVIMKLYEIYVKLMSLPSDYFIFNIACGFIGIQLNNTMN